ncbi:enoyl-CoA hydratase/isomerase family protein [Geodermatophilus sp. URMC 64]
MPSLDEYRNRYSTISLERSPNGVLLVRLHDDGGPFVMGRQAHTELSEVFFDIAADRENRVVVITGTGETFNDRVGESTAAGKASPSGWDHIRWTAERILTGLMDVEVPVIAAINGPITVHPCWPFLADVVLCAEHAVIQDTTHFTAGRVPGDGNNIVWEMLMGPNRSRYFLLTGQRIPAEQALSLGLVGEVLPLDALLDRALELANGFAERKDLTLRATRRALTFELRRRIRNDLDHGLAIEALAYLDDPRT